MKLSAVIPTKNESANIEACVRSFAGAMGEVDVVVVDNFSDDDTVEKAKALGARVFSKGPERSAQRNLGWREAKGDWVIFLDADMILPEETLAEIFKTIDSPDAADAYWMPETRTGKGWRVKARNFERGFYNGTCIDALRLFRKSILEKTGGYDENLIAGPEDWELDIRVLATTAKCRVMEHNLIHNEKHLTLKRTLEKKAYYTKSFAAYKAKWSGHPAVKRQFSPFYRFIGVFVENGKWKRVLAHPILFASVLIERFLIGVVYLAKG